MNDYRNSEGYYDPTAGEALSRISQAERPKRRKGKRGVFVRTEVWVSAKVYKKNRRES